ncbi:MAG: polyprenyl synthetase family protein [Bacteroidota bacterium]
MTVRIDDLLGLINKEITKYSFEGYPSELYEPMRYIMDLGGKRMRPLLTLLSYSLYKDDPENIIEPAMAVEVFHNFTLMHDDIMDQAPLRRGKQTVHEKWNSSIAILSGDAMLVKAYKMFLTVENGRLNRVLKAFNRTAIEVCEGQQKDMNFEDRLDVSVEEYLDMISQKTAVLLGFSLELGALLGGADDRNCQFIREFGVNIGVGFQLKDDLLDVYADQAKFGKQVGGDIIANKKTFLLIEALEMAEGNTKKELERWLKMEEFDKEEKVEAVKAIYDELNIKAITEEKMAQYFDTGFKSLKKLEVPLNKRAVLRGFAEDLINREK